MVARIVRGKDIVGLIRYNEKEKSSILYAQLINDAKDTEELTLKDKIQAFQAYINLNPKLAKPTFHVSLNPDPDDQLSDEQLEEIGREYMERMHYGAQPYIIYKHEDIDRAHIHIISVSIGLNGKAIPSSNDRYRSEEIRKDLEVKYHLVKAGEKVKEGQNVFAPIDVAAIEYGKTDTKSAIAAVVRSATRDFKCTTLPEFRTLLNQYHVTLDEVKDSADPEKTLGLYYAVSNQRGEKVSARIKASSIGSGVGYEALLEKFSRDEKQIREGNLKSALSRKIKSVLQAFPYLSRADFQARLQEQGVQAVLRQTREDRLYDITFIDANTKAVLNGRSLGKAFSGHALGQRIGDVTLSGRQLLAANKQLAAIYHQWRKTEPAYYYESSLIKALPQLSGRLAGALQAQLPAMAAEQARLAVADFISYRQSRLAKVEEKESGYFLSQAPALVAFISRNQELSLKQKLSFLYASNVAFSQKGGILQVHAVRSPEIGYTLPGTDIFKLLQARAADGKLTATEGEIPVLTKADKEIIRLFARPEGERKYSELNIGPINNLTRLAVLPFLTRADRHLLFSHANLNYVTGFFHKVEKGLDYGQTLSRMLENGIIIKPVTDQKGDITSFHLGYYRLPESSFVRAGQKVEDMLRASHFTSNTAASIHRLVYRPMQDGSTRTSIKYDVIVRLSLALKQNDQKAAHNILDFIRKINKPLATEIDAKWMNYVKQESQLGGHGKPKEEKDLIELIRRSVAGYPSDTLREPDRQPSYASRYSPEARRGASLMESLGELFAGFTDAIAGKVSQVQPEEHRPEQKRKKRRRPRW